MQRGNVYPILVGLLEDWRSRPAHELRAMLGRAPESRDVEIDGQIYSIDVQVSPSTTSANVIVIEAVARGYNDQTSPRFEERLEVRL